MRLRTVSGGRWTADGRWVVINEHEEIVYDESGSLLDPTINGNIAQAWVDLDDCRWFVTIRAAHFLDKDGRPRYPTEDADCD